MNRLSPLAALSDLIEKRRKRALIQAENRRLLFSMLRIIAGFAIVVTVFLILFSFHVVEGNDMFPALRDGDLVLTYSKREYIKNDIVFYEAEGELHCGRVVAKGGDNVSISDNKLFVNGTSQTTEIAFPTTGEEKWKTAVPVPENTVFILGDYRPACEDSRIFGFIPIDKVKSKVIVMIRHKTL